MNQCRQGQECHGNTKISNSLTADVSGGRLTHLEEEVRRVEKESRAKVE